MKITGILRARGSGYEQLLLSAYFIFQTRTVTNLYTTVPEKLAATSADNDYLTPTDEVSGCLHNLDKLFKD